eukprot:6484076-Amphidinium_carterae.1
MAQTKVQVLETKHMKALQAKCAGRLDLILLLEDELDKWLAAEAGLQPLKRKKTFESPGASEASAGADTPVTCQLKIEDNEDLGRNSRKYANWNKKICYDLLHYLSPGTFAFSQQCVDSLLIMKQMIEWATGVRITDKKTSDS